MKYVMCIVFCCLLCLGKAQQRVTGQKPEITAPPLELKLNPFYKKYLNANGIHIIASWWVPGFSLNWDFTRKELKAYDRGLYDILSEFSRL